MKPLISIFLILIFFITCKKKDTSNTNPVPPISTNTDNLLANNSHILDTSAIISATLNSLIINKNSTSLRPRVGDILVASPSSKETFGLLVKVINVTENADQITIGTEQSNLNDAFKQLYIDYTNVDTFTSNALFTSVNSTGSSVSITLSDNNSIVPGIKLNGEIKFNIPTVKLEYKRKLGSLAPEKVLIEADFDTEGSTLEITNTDEAAINIIDEIALKTFYLPTLNVPVTIGPIVLIIPFTQKIIIKMLPISISGKAKWTTLPEITAVLGCKYENSDWSNLSTYSIAAASMPLLQGDFSPTLSLVAKATIFKPVYEIAPLGSELLKGFFEIPNDLEFTLQNSIPNYSLKYKLDVTGGIKQKFYTGIEQEFSITGHLIEKTILEGNWASVILSTASVSSITQTSAVTGGNITDDGGISIISRGVCWNVTPNPTTSNNKTIDGDGTGSRERLFSLTYG